MDAFLATVMGWAPNFAPRNWAYCQGQLLAINQATALFSLIGTIYGGDGRTTFALPDLRGRALVGSGFAPGLQPYVIGQRGGLEFVTLNIPELPVHTHTAALTGASVTLGASNADGTTNDPTGAYFAKGQATDGFSSPIPANVYSTGSVNTTMAPTAISGTVSVGVTGNSSSHENRTPYQVLNWIIALEGIFPSRN